MELLTILLSGFGDFLGTPIFDAEDFLKLITKTVFNLVVITAIIRYIYYPVTKNKDYLFTYFLISLTVFLLCVLLDSVKLQLGFALGLFAIFGIIRYRTDPIPIKEMTYLFIVIGVSLMNAFVNKKMSYTEVVFANAAIVFTIGIIERGWNLNYEVTKEIVYENIENIKPENYELLKSDIELRTGITVNKVTVESIDFLKDTAIVIMYYNIKN